MKAADLVVAHLEQQLKDLEEGRRLSVKRRKYYFDQETDLIREVDGEIMRMFPELSKIEDWERNRLLRPAYASDAEAYIRGVMTYTNDPQLVMLARRIADSMVFVSLPASRWASVSPTHRTSVLLITVLMPKKGDYAQRARAIGKAVKQADKSNPDHDIVARQREIRDTIAGVRRFAAEMDQ